MALQAVKLPDEDNSEVVGPKGVLLICEACLEVWTWITAPITLISLTPGICVLSPDLITGGLVSYSEP